MRLSEQSTGHLTTSAQKIQWVNCTTHIPEPLQGITLPTPLPTNLHCGLLTVPMDYSKSISSSNNITLGFAMRRPKNPVGLLNFNPGGPNQEVASNAWAFALNDTSNPEDIFGGLEAFDFLAMDTRGTYQSNPLNCPLGNLTLPSYLPSTEEEFKSYQGIMSTFAKSCIDNSTPPGVVEYLATKQTIEDWNSLRAALGYDKMSLLGVSYGSYGGALYASKYPQHVDRFVIDAIYSRGVRNVDLGTYQMSAVNRLLLRADAYCLNDTSCPFHAQGKGAIPAAFAEVLSQAAAGNTSNTTVTPTDVRAVVTLEFLSANPLFPELNEVLYLALNGNWTALQWTDAFGIVYTANALPVFTALCADLHIDNNTWEGYKALKKAAFEVDTARIEYAQDLSAVGLCGGWPYPGDSNVPIVQDVPMLIVTSDFDLNTPTESATFEFKQAKKSTLVVRHGDDHGTVTVPGASKNIEFEFIRTGVFPKAQNETYVTVYEPGSVRAPVSNPYDVPVGPAAGDIY
ncbi:alpha/beta-hydrolase [Athelia psychrophila]|uniref:Alpha/beta-hydrolase n=1 Tax=Athelia psychrophila TaxID=1759441 RepID=A0A166K6A3_9AGAM|nr:alpha/beta-hydrolase [Fibularhizoctonia sp. CBS 109695]